MAPKLAAVEAPDDVLEQLKGLAADASSAQESFKKKLMAGALNDPAALAVEVGELFSILADVSQYAFQAHTEHFEWGSEVDEHLEELDDALGQASTLLPEDAARLKTTITALAGALTGGAALSADALADLKKQAEEAIAFIDEVTVEDPDPEDTE